MALRVLVVDDDPSECELLLRTLQTADIQAVTVTDGYRAIEILRDQTFDAIFVDANMPPPNGMEVTRQIRSSGSNQKTPIIMIAGDEERSIAAQGFRAGITFFLYKPITKEQLLKLVRVTPSVNAVEPRRFHRVMVRHKVEVEFNADIVEGQTIDVSLTGLLVRASRTFPSGSHVKVRLALSPGKPSLVVTGVVVRVPTGNTMGIQLDPIDISESNQLQGFLLPLTIARDSVANLK